MRRWIVILASLVLVLALARVAGFGTIATVWRSLDPRGVAVSVACYFAALAVRGLCWHRLLGSAAPPVRTLAPPLALGFVLSHVAPAKTGEPAPALLLARSTGIPLATSLSVLAAERGAHLVTLLATFVPAAALTAGSVLALSGAARAAALLLAIAVAVLPLTPGVLGGASRWAARLPRVGATASSTLSALAALVGSPATMAPLLALSVVFWILQYVSLAAILRAGDVSVNLPQAAAVSGAAILGGTLTLLPLGTQDGISALALGGLGVPLERGFALALFHSTLSLLCGAALAAGLAARAAGEKATPPAAH